MIRRWFSRILLSFALGFAGFLLGLASYHYHWGLYRAVYDAKITAQAIYSHFQPPAPVIVPGAVRDLPRLRVRTLVPNAYHENFLLAGGFHDRCPQAGCLFAVLSRHGEVVRSAPYRPEQLAAHEIIALPYETMFFNVLRDTAPFGLVRLPGGDWVTSLGRGNSFPYGGGLARMKPDGQVVWYRADYSHHWVSMTGDGDIVVPAAIVTDVPIRVTLAGKEISSIACGHAGLRDVIRILSPDGAVKEEILVTDALLRSPFRAHILHTVEPCDPTHVNFVQPVGSALAAALGPEVKPGDLLVSMRQLSAFGILSRDSKRFTRIFHGSFAFQHGVRPLDGARVIMIDNQGGAGLSGNSRVLIIDLATGQETVLFPLPTLALGRRVFTALGGMIDVSSDGTRILATFTGAGKAYEIRLSDGALLTEIDYVDSLPHGRLSSGTPPTVLYDR